MKIMLAFFLALAFIMPCLAEKNPTVAIVNGEIISQRDLMETLEKCYTEDEIDGMHTGLMRLYLQEIIIFKVMEQNLKNETIKCVAKDYMEDVERYEKPFLAYYLRWGMENSYHFVENLKVLVAESQEIKKKFGPGLEKIQPHTLKSEDQKFLMDLWQALVDDKDMKSSVRKLIYEKYHMDYQVFKQRIRIITKFRKYIEQTITPQEIQNFASKESFALADGLMKISHLFLPTRQRDNNEPFSAEQEAKVKQQILTIANEIKSDLSNFAEVVQKYSQDTSTKYMGGDLGWVPRWTASTVFSAFLKHIGWVPHPCESFPEVIDAAYSLPEKTLSQPVKSTWGYHLLVVTSRQAGPTIDQTDLLKRSQDMLTLLKMEKQLREWIKQSKIEHKL